MTFDMDTMELMPELQLAGDKIVLADTGEVIHEGETVPVTVAAVLEHYATTKMRADLLAVELREIRENMIHDMVDAALNDNEAYVADQLKLSLMRAEMTNVEDRLAEFFGDREAKVSLDVRKVLVTWPKPRDNWSIAHSPAWYAEGKAENEIGSILNRVLNTALADVLPDHVQMRVDELRAVASRCAAAVIDWLAPTNKLSEPGKPLITVRTPR